MPPVSTASLIRDLIEAVRALAERIVVAELKTGEAVRVAQDIRAELGHLRADLAPMIRDHAAADAKAAARAELHAESAAFWGRITGPIAAVLGSPWGKAAIVAAIVGALRLLGVDPGAAVLDVLTPSGVDRGASSQLAIKTPKQIRRTI